MATRKRRPATSDLRSPWQIAQAAVCGCGGSDDLCSCQNEDAPWRYGLGPKPPERITAWLLEWPADDNLPTRYWNPKTGWMMDPNKGCWFAREADAADYKATNRIVGVVRPVEHVFGLTLAPSEGVATTTASDGEAGRGGEADCLRPNTKTPPQQPGDVGKLMRKVAAQLLREADNLSPSAGTHPAPFMRKCAAQIQEALSTLSPTEGEGKPDMRKVVEALGFEPDNHHNALHCPYCNPKGLSFALPQGEGNASGDGQTGWLFFNPDTGTEWAAQHPIESGECPDAQDVRPANAANLKAALLLTWEVMAERDAPAPVSPAMAEEVARIIRDAIIQASALPRSYGPEALSLERGQIARWSAGAVLKHLSSQQALSGWSGGVADSETPSNTSLKALQGAGESGGTAIADIAAERRRQIEVEGWSPDHDDQHDGGALAKAAACYAACNNRLYVPGPTRNPNGHGQSRLWPWAPECWKPKDRRRNLVRAGALIIAEVDRLDRLSALEGKAP